MSCSLLCVVYLVTSLASASDKHCTTFADGPFSAPPDSYCDDPPSGRGLLQTAAERQMHPAFDAAGEAVPTATVQQVTASNTAPAKEAGKQGVSTGPEHASKGLPSSGKGMVDKQDAGYVMMTSVSDVFSVMPSADPPIGDIKPHRRLLMIVESVRAHRSVELVTVTIIIVMSIFGILLAYLAGNRRNDDRHEHLSSDSERFGSAPKYKAQKTPARAVKTAESPLPVTAQLHDHFSPAPAPAVRPSMQGPPAAAPARFSPTPPVREIGRKSSPFVTQAQPYQMQQSPPMPSEAQVAVPAREPGRSGRSPEAKVAAPTPDSGPPSRPPTSSQSSASRPLCPGLVVPKGNECVLAVPTFRAMNVPPRNTAAFFVRDRFGQPVIQVEILVQPWTLLGGRPIAVLRTAIFRGEEPATISTSSPVLACVKASYEAGGRPMSVSIYDARDELFADIAKDPVQSRYVLTGSRMGVQVIFSGTPQEHRVHVTNEAGEALADVEPCTMEFEPPGEYYKLRVVPLVDVGLVLCGLLAMEHMEAA